MNDITKRWGFQRILHESVRYRTLRDQYRVLRGAPATSLQIFLIANSVSLMSQHSTAAFSKIWPPPTNRHFMT
jgi:hypothetical protein